MIVSGKTEHFSEYTVLNQSEAAGTAQTKLAETVELLLQAVRIQVRMEAACQAAHCRIRQQ